MTGEATPNLFVVGAAKSGTTSLWKALRAHPQVFMTRMKEPHYFSQVVPSPQWASRFPVVRSASEYRRLFADAKDERYRGEASTSYLWSSAAADRIAQVQPDARIIAVLRDPIERAYSHYWNDVREGLEKQPFEAAVRAELSRQHIGQWGRDSLYIDVGRYFRQVTAYVDRFEDRVLVLSYSDLVSDPNGALTRTWQFLGLPPTAGKQELARENPAQVARGRLSHAVLGSHRLRLLGRSVLPRRGRQLAREMLLKPTTRPPMGDGVRTILTEALLDDWQSTQLTFLRR
jgi:hypothetical protein